MVLAWYMDDDTEADQRLPHKPEATEYVTLEKLKKLGVYYWLIDPNNFEEDFDYQRLKDERGYSYQDEIECSPERLKNYQEMIKSFYEEHIHKDEEVRYVLDGSGYFDIRDPGDRWIRIEVTRGDLIILPAGIYHRFTLDSKNYIKALRLFVGEPVWTPYPRSKLSGDDPTVGKYRAQITSSD